MTDSTPDEESEKSDRLLPLWGHLDELRGSLIRSLVAVSLGFAVAYAYVEPLLKFLEAPLLEVLPAGQGHLYYTGLTDKFMTYLKVAMIAGIFLVSPYLLYEVWRFVSPGLYRKEKRFALPFLVLGTLSFVVGLAFAYYGVIPVGYRFLIEFGSPTEQPLITLTSYFSLTLKLLLAMGLVFELPVLLVLLAKFGFIDAATLQKGRKHAFLICAVVAALLTPTPDAVTMLLVMVPLYILYEAGIVGVRVFAPV